MIVVVRLLLLVVVALADTDQPALVSYSDTGGYGLRLNVLPNGMTESTPAAELRPSGEVVIAGPLVVNQTDIVALLMSQAAIIAALQAQLNPRDAWDPDVHNFAAIPTAGGYLTTYYSGVYGTGFLKEGYTRGNHFCVFWLATWIYSTADVAVGLTSNRAAHAAYGMTGYIGQLPADLGYWISGATYTNNLVVASGLPAWTHGSYVGVRLFMDALRVQFNVDGGPFTQNFTLPAAPAYWMGASNGERGGWKIMNCTHY